MNVSARLNVGALVFTAALAFSLGAPTAFATPYAPPELSQLAGQTGPWLFQANTNYFYDYTIYPTGLKERWDFHIDSADPNARIFLEPPNETFAIGTISEWGELESGNGGYVGSGSYYWSEEHVRGLTMYTVEAPAPFDDCAHVDPNVNIVCAETDYIWGNGTILGLISNAPAIVTLDFVAVPEPATWTVILLGFFGLGAMLRTRRQRA